MCGSLSVAASCINVHKRSACTYNCYGSCMRATRKAGRLEQHALYKSLSKKSCLRCSSRVTAHDRREQVHRRVQAARESRMRFASACSPLNGNNIRACKSSFMTENCSVTALVLRHDVSGSIYALYSARCRSLLLYLLARRHGLGSAPEIADTTSQVPTGRLCLVYRRKQPKDVTLAGFHLRFSSG